MEVSAASKKRSEDFLGQLQRKRPELEKELLKKWPYLTGAASTIISLGFLIWYLEKKAQRGKKESLKKVIKEIAEKTLPETDPAKTSEKLGNSSLLVVSPEVAQDFEQLKNGEGREEIERWTKRIGKILKVPPPTEKLSENLVAITAAFVDQVLAPQEKKSEESTTK